MINGIKKVMFSEIKGDIFNLGNPDEYTILEIAKKIKDLTKSGSEIVFCSLPEDDPIRRRPDITKAKGIGWEPKTSLEMGLKETIKWFKRVF